MLQTALARPPRTAERRTLASAASLTPAPPPGLEVVEDVLFGESPLLDLAAHFSAQPTENSSRFNSMGSVVSGRGKKIPASLAATCDEDGVLGAQQPRGIVTELAELC